MQVIVLHVIQHDLIASDPLLTCELIDTQMLLSLLARHLHEPVTLMHTLILMRDHARSEISHEVHANHPTWPQTVPDARPMQV